MINDGPTQPDLDWSPVKGGGTNFGTHKLVEIDRQTLAFRPTAGALVFYWVFIVFGLVPMAISVWQILDTGFGLKPEILIPFGFGLVFGAVGLTMFAFGTRPIVFDRNREYFWKGRKDPDAVWDKREIKHFAQLGEVSGIQVLTEVVSGDKGSFRSYEINLVLKNGTRVNVVDHGNVERIKQDARRLSEFLGVEILTREWS